MVDLSNSDFKEFCECLNRHNVEYVVVGGYAVAFYGAPRYTGDFDTFVRPARENLQKALNAIAEFGFGDATREVTPEQWLERRSILIMGAPPNRIDVLVDIDGVSFDEAREGAIQATYGGAPVQYIGYQALLRNKAAAGRTKDAFDVEALTSGRTADADSDQE